MILVANPVQDLKNLFYPVLELDYFFNDRREKIRTIGILNNTCVEGTTYNHGRPEGISEDQHPMNQFLGMLRAGPPIRTQIYGIIPRGCSLPTSPDPAP